MFIRKLFTSMFSRSHLIKKFQNPSADRNSAPILHVLQEVLNRDEPHQRLLEIASGTGQHSAFFAPHFPNIQFCPTENNPHMLNSIRAYRQDVATNNMTEPVTVDIRQPFIEWDQRLFNANGRMEFNYILCINMMHISEIRCSEGLFENASYLLKNNGILITYGPYAVNGVLQPESNVSFDKSLRSQNNEWGVRDIADLKKIAERWGITFQQAFEMPANNKCLIWRKNCESANT